LSGPASDIALACALPFLVLELRLRSLAWRRPARGIIIEAPLTPI
jgi:hypothetical protein